MGYTDAWNQSVPEALKCTGKSRTCTSYETGMDVSLQMEMKLDPLLIKMDRAFKDLEAQGLGHNFRSHLQVPT